MDDTAQALTAANVRQVTGQRTWQKTGWSSALVPAQRSCLPLNGYPAGFVKVYRSAGYRRPTRPHDVPLNMASRSPRLTRNRCRIWSLMAQIRLTAIFGLSKGRGAALTREKCVAAAGTRLVIVIDEQKLVDALSGTVPVEVLPFALRPVMTRLERPGMRSRPAGGHQEGWPGDHRQREFYRRLRIWQDG